MAKNDNKKQAEKAAPQTNDSLSVEPSISTCTLTKVTSSGEALSEIYTNVKTLPDDSLSAEPIIEGIPTHGKSVDEMIATTYPVAVEITSAATDFNVTAKDYETDSQPFYVRTEKTFTADEVEEFKKTWLAAQPQSILIDTAIVEPKLPVAKELEIAVNNAIANKQLKIADELNKIIVCFMNLRNQLSYLHTNAAQQESIVARIKSEVLGIEI